MGNVLFNPLSTCLPQQQQSPQETQTHATEPCKFIERVHASDFLAKWEEFGEEDFQNVENTSPVKSTVSSSSTTSSDSTSNQEKKAVGALSLKNTKATSKPSSTLAKNESQPRQQSSTQKEQPQGNDNADFFSHMAPVYKAPKKIEMGQLEITKRLQMDETETTAPPSSTSPPSATTEQDSGWEV